jgi:hypothetical protein
MFGNKEVHKETILTLFQIAIAVGAFVLFFYGLSILISPEFAVGALIGVPIFTFLYCMLYADVEHRMMEHKKWKEFHEDIMKNGRYRPD